MNTRKSRAPKFSVKALTAAIGVALLTSCGVGTTVETQSAGKPNANADGSNFNLTADQNRIIPDKVDAIANMVPSAVKERGTLVVAMGVGQNQYPPLAFTATDNKTLIGSEPDIATLISSVMGLKLEIVNTSFEDVTIGVDSGKYDASIANIGVSAARIQKYDMATYRKNMSAFEAKKGTTLRIDKPEDVSGKTVAVKPGTLQATQLQGWSDQLVAKGMAPIDIKSYAASSAAFLAVQSGQIDAYLTIGATADFNAALPGAEIEVVGHFPTDVVELISTLSLKGGGLAEPMCAAINHVMENGDMHDVLARWNMQDYAIDKCEINPTQK